MRFFAPPALVVTLGLSVLVAILQATGVLTGWWSLAASLVYLPVIAYALLVVAAASRTW